MNVDKEWVISKLVKFLKIQSISAQGKGIREACRFLVSLFEMVGLKARIFETAGNPVVYAEYITSPKAKTMIFYNHYDVQPPDPITEWASNPFDPTIRDEKLFARGVSDNKGDLVARVSAVKDLLDKKALRVNVRFIVEGEEETGSPNLERFINTHLGLLQGELCIWECGGRDENGRLEIVLGCKGVVHAELVCKGNPQDLHSSFGNIVKNPAWRLLWALASLKDKSGEILIHGFYDDVKPPTPNEIETLRDIPFNPQRLKRYGIEELSENCKGKEGVELLLRHLYRPGLNISGIRSGYQGLGNKTIIPQDAIAKIDLRLVPNQTPEDIIKKIRNHLDRTGFKDVKIEGAGGYCPAKTPLDHPVIDVVRDVAKEVYGKTPIVYPLMAASGPMYLFTSSLPCISFGVGHPGSNTHAPNESIRLEDLFLGIEYIKRLIQSFSSSMISTVKV